jgi:peptidoglycan/xylan/chitin deacetylase (PgdA/CDA1 family)
VEAEAAFKVARVGPMSKEGTTLSTRERFARVVDRLGLFNLVLVARERSLLPAKRVALMTFHRVARPEGALGDPEVIDTSPERLDEIVGFLARRFTFIDTGDLQAFRAGIPLPRSPALLSFDDGYRDNFDNAFPVLRRHGAKAVFFIASSFTSERKLYWWERIGLCVKRAAVPSVRLTYPQALELPLGSEEARRQARRVILRVVKDHGGLDLPRFLDEVAAGCGLRWDPAEERRLADELLMTWDHIRELKAAGMDIQSHSHAHRVAHTMAPAELEQDLRTSRAIIESEVGGEVRALAYPTGRGVAADPERRRAVEAAGFSIAFTNEGGILSRGRPVDWLNVPRLTTSLDMSDSFLRGCLAFGELAYRPTQTTKTVKPVKPVRDK